MIVDLDRGEIEDAIQADICVIGGGAAGITIAQEFAGKNVDVCLVEGGALAYEDESQALFRGESVGAPVALEFGRLRFLGGTTNHWGGRCAMLDPLDFAAREWVDHSGWPIDRAELDPYYRRALKVAGFQSGWISDDEARDQLRLKYPALNAEKLQPFLWRFSELALEAPFSWGTVYHDVLARAANIKVILHANVEKFEAHADRRALSKLHVRSLSGRSLSVTAKAYVLCCGGLENPRLLSIAARQNGGGFGTQRDLVGRFLMQHPRGRSGVLVPEDRISDVQDVFNYATGANGLKYQVGLALASAAQRDQGLLNCSAVLTYNGDPASGVVAGQDIWRSLHEGRWGPDLGEKVWRVATDLSAFARNAQRRITSGKRPLLPLSSADITLDIEQAPNADSRVLLSDTVDAIGLPEIRVDWRLGELERKTAAWFTMSIAQEFARLGIGRCRLDPWVLDSTIPMAQALDETFHYIGTTRMTDSPERGVVDSDCRVHDMDNLYVAGSSVFPTAGQANPTLTIVALALRLAGHLSSVLG